MGVRINDVLRSVLPTAPFSGVHRVLWIHADLARGWDLVVTIEIPVQSPNAPATRYYKAPIKRDLSTVEAAMATGAVVITRPALPALV
jgi:hypothetical protein